MKCPVVAMAAFVASASAQFTTGTFVTFDWRWSESDHNGNPVASPNGVLEPGESMLLSLDVSFSNQNTTATYTPPSPSPGWGTIRGFAATMFDLVGTQNAQGSWNLDPLLGLATHPDWDLVGAGGHGTALSGGTTLAYIQLGQFPMNAAAINTMNPIAGIWKGVWTPQDYTSRTVSFGGQYTMHGGFWVLFAIGSTGLASVHCAGSYGEPIHIPVAPVPATTLLLAAASLCTLRPRRRLLSRSRSIRCRPSTAISA